ncbi:MAG: MraY family glycosyltransferase [Rectinemataceae bacterium]|nr:MraY family glycosyltransferase [Rectinemataceae bacterium]
MKIVAFFIAMTLCAAIMPAIMWYAKKKKLYDSTGGRKIHSGQVARLGGIGVFTAFILTILIFAMLERSFRTDLTIDLRYWPVFLGLVSLFALGVVDDFVSLRARFKAMVQFGAALLVVGMGFRFRVVFIPWGGGTLNLGFLSVPLTLAWIVGVTNALNLIDGMDGLLGGITVFAASAFGFFFAFNGDLSSTVICFALAGASAGFLVYNLPIPKAKIFMGDSGALFIGFTLSVLPLLNQTETSAEVGLISAVTVLGIPVLDTLAAIYRRQRAGVHFFTPDRGHMHHMFLDLGYSVWGILARTYLMCLLLDLAALSTLYLSASGSFALKILSLSLLVISYYSLVCRAREVAGSGISAVGSVSNPEALKPVRIPVALRKNRKINQKEA